MDPETNSGKWTSAHAVGCLALLLFVLAVAIITVILHDAIPGAVAAGLLAIHFLVEYVRAKRKARTEGESSPGSE